VNPASYGGSVTALPSEAAYDPLLRLKHDQREIPAEVKAAARALDEDLLEHKR
jgi:hypothetical protein